MTLLAQRPTSLMNLRDIPSRWPSSTSGSIETPWRQSTWPLSKSSWQSSSCSRGFALEKVYVDRPATDQAAVHALLGAYSMAGLTVWSYRACRVRQCGPRQRRGRRRHTHRRVMAAGCARLVQDRCEASCREAMQRHRQSIEDGMCGFCGGSWPCGPYQLAVRAEEVSRAPRSQWRRAHTMPADPASTGGRVDSGLYRAFAARRPSPRPAAVGVASCA